MSEEKPRTFRIPRVKSDALIKIDVSATFLKRCQNLLMGISNELGEEAVKEALARFKKEDLPPVDLREATLFIMLGLISEVERKANEQGLVEIMEVSPEQLDQMRKEVNIT